MFLIDTNVFIEAKNRYYGFDISPGFWDWLEQAHRRKLVCSIDAVYNELTAGGDDLSVWAQNHRYFFHSIDGHTVSHFTRLTGWANSQSFTQAALQRFTGTDADYLLVAYAAAHDLTVVTHEHSNPMSRKRVLIPDACEAMGVKVCTTFEMLREDGMQMVLRS